VHHILQGFPAFRPQPIPPSSTKPVFQDSHAFGLVVGGSSGLPCPGNGLRLYERALSQLKALAQPDIIEEWPSCPWGDFQRNNFDRQKYPMRFLNRFQK
jgi:hypothetical protein